MERTLLQPIVSPAGKDSVVILDLADPENPKIVANLPLKNSIVGPPVNLAIDPTNSVALVADSIDVIKEGDALKMVPDNKVYVIDLKANPAKLAASTCSRNNCTRIQPVIAPPSANAASGRATSAGRTSSTSSVSATRWESR